MSRFSVWFKKCKIDEIKNVEVTNFVRTDSTRRCLSVILYSGRKITFGPYRNHYRAYKDCQKIVRKWKSSR